MPNPAKTSAGQARRETPQETAQQRAGSRQQQEGKEESPAGVPGCPCSGGIITSVREGRTSRGASRKVLRGLAGCWQGRPHLGGCHVTPGTPRAEEEAPAHPTHTRGAALPSAVPHQRRCLSLSAPRGDTGAGGAPLTPLAPLAPRLPDKRLLFRARAPTAPPEARAQPPAFQPQETSLLPADPSLNITALRNQCKSHPCVLELFAEPGQACPHGPVSWRAPRPAR